MTRSCLLVAVVALLYSAFQSATRTAVAFAPTVVAVATVKKTNEAARRGYVFLHAETDEKQPESAFVPLEDEDDDDETLQLAERLGRGAAKIKRGKRKGSSVESSSAPRPTKASLAPEETFYEGPPAITETILPTISILTVVGIVPAAAAWARQAWVRYKITNRRIRVTSGFQGKDMAEIVYPDIVELRTVKRLFGDGDLVAFLRDGAKFEMRNVPDFDATIDFILKHVDGQVAETYKKKGDVTNP